MRALLYLVGIAFFFVAVVLALGAATERSAVALVAALMCLLIDCVLHVAVLLMDIRDQILRATREVQLQLMRLNPVEKDVAENTPSPQKPSAPIKLKEVEPEFNDAAWPPARR